jgi:hypothetical protein
LEQSVIFVFLKVKHITDLIAYFYLSIPTAHEHIAAAKIQAAWRGHSTRKMYHARKPTTAKNLSVGETLKKSWSIVEDKLQENALYLFRYNIKQFINRKL